MVTKYKRLTRRKNYKDSRHNQKINRQYVWLWGVVLVLFGWFLLRPFGLWVAQHTTLPAFVYPYLYSGIPGTQPLAIKKGDPYIRALMRTISASESNVERPYHVLYGGQYVASLSEHPGICVPIKQGPNIGKCSTAAGRYQILLPTWRRLVKKYHPNPEGWWLFKTYSFEPVYQDRVVHSWLSGPEWNPPIPKQLRDGKIMAVLKQLSGTWTSLGYGIETNSMSQKLPHIYAAMLKEELKQYNEANSHSNR